MYQRWLHCNNCEGILRVVLVLLGQCFEPVLPEFQDLESGEPTKVSREVVQQGVVEVELGQVQELGETFW